MSYAATQNRFRQPLAMGATCGNNEHMDWETGQCAPGWCPAGQEVEPSTGNCVPAGTATSHQGGSRDVEYVDYQPDSGGGGSARASATGAAGAPIATATLIGLAAVGVIAYAFYVRVSA